MAGVPAQIPPSAFLYLEDEYGVRFAIITGTLTYFRDDGPLRTIKYSTWNGNGNAIVEMKVRTTYEDIRKQVGG